MQNTMLDSIVSSNSQALSNASSAIKLFENPLFKARVIMRCFEPWFVAKDVATCIEHSNVTKMCELCRDKDKVTITDSQEIGVINESLITQQTFSKNTPNVVLIRTASRKPTGFSPWVSEPYGEWLHHGMTIPA